MAIILELEAENDRLNIGNEPINVLQIQINNFFIDILVEQALTGSRGS